MKAMMDILKFRLPAYITFLISAAFCFFYFIVLRPPTHLFDGTPEVMNMAVAAPCKEVTIKRLGGYNFISPIMFVDEQNKAQRLSSIQQKVLAYIESKKSTKELTNCSFYLKNGLNTDWTGINEDEKFLPGSLLKVPILISYLRLEEQTNAGILNKQIRYDVRLMMDCSQCT